MDESRQAGGGALPDLILYSKPGCHLCDEARAVLEALLVQRRGAAGFAPRLVERDISTNPDWERAYFATIPVVELGADRLELATSVGRLRALLARLDTTTAPARS